MLFRSARADDGERNPDGTVPAGEQVIERLTEQIEALNKSLAEIEALNKSIEESARKLRERKWPNDGRMLEHWRNHRDTVRLPRGVRQG